MTDHPRETIAAPASGSSRRSRLALLRLSGDAIASLLDSVVIVRPPNNHAPLAARWAGQVEILLAPADTPTESSVARLRLPALAMHALPGASFTGERTLELIIPGNPALITRVLHALTSVPDIRIATPGEFSQRAYHAGRLTLAQAEGLAALIAADSTQQLESARAVLSGDSGRHYQAWADEIATLLALVEAGVDFSDQEGVIAIAPSELLHRVQALVVNIRQRLASRAGARIGTGAPVVALWGKPNAGKSTLFNALLGRPRAIVSPLAGTTRDALLEPLRLNGPAGRAVDAELMDLAGVDTTRLPPRWRGSPEPCAESVKHTDTALESRVTNERSTTDELAVQHARAAARKADIVIWCDPTGLFAPTDAPGSGEGTESMVGVIRVRTKADLAAIGDEANTNVNVTQSPRSNGDAMPILNLCAIDGFGLDDLGSTLFSQLWTSAGRPDSLELLPRHQLAVRACLETLEHLAEQLTTTARSAHTTLPAELIAPDLRDALDALGQLTGKVERDDILGRIFASFCIGK